MKSPRAEGGGIARPRRQRRREERAQPHGSSAAQRPRPRPSGRARPSRPSSWRLSRARTTRRPSPRATCASSSPPRPAWTCAWCRSAPRAPAPAASLPAPRAPRPLTRCPSPGLVPEPPSQGEETEEGRGPAALGSVFPQHEARPRGLQVRQGQRPGGGAGQRRRGLLRRYAQARGAPPASSGPGRKERGAGWSQGAWKSEFPSKVACLALLKKKPICRPWFPTPEPCELATQDYCSPPAWGQKPCGLAWPGGFPRGGGRVPTQGGSQPALWLLAFVMMFRCWEGPSVGRSYLLPRQGTPTPSRPSSESVQ